MSDERYNRGANKVKELYGDVGANVLDSMDDIAPELARYVKEFAFGDIYSRPGLDLRSREIATIASLVTQGNAPRELKAHIHGALHVGITQTEIVEIIMQMAVYAGFPAAINGMHAAKEAFALHSERTPTPASPPLPRSAEERP